MCSTCSAILTIASDRAKFGQVGPKVGSVDPGFGIMYLARIVGEKKAREFWYLCEQYTAEDCCQMGLVNKVVPAAQLMNHARAWARKIASMSPTAITLAKASFNAPRAGRFAASVPWRYVHSHSTTGLKRRWKARTRSSKSGRRSSAGSVGEKRGERKSNAEVIGWCSRKSCFFRIAQRGAN
jgi:enoyl-CoA hydratase/carnithine racemase